MRRFLVLALTMALGLTALVAVPAAATSADDDKDCTVVRTTEGRECLTDAQIKLFHDRDDKYRDRDDKYRDRDDKYRDRDDKYRDRDKRDDRYDRNKRDRDYRIDRWWDLWFGYWDDRSDSCDCLSRWERDWLEDLADNPTLTNARRILRFLYDQDCLTQREFRQFRNKARNLDRSDLLDIIRDADRCEYGSQGYWLYDRDYRQLGRMSGLNARTIRRILGTNNGRDYVDRSDLRRLGNRIGGSNDWDFLDLDYWWG
jgi:hypothetical protein